MDLSVIHTQAQNIRTRSSDRQNDHGNGFRVSNRLRIKAEIGFSPFSLVIFLARVKAL